MEMVGSKFCGIMQSAGFMQQAGLVMQLNGLGHMFMVLNDACDIGLRAQSG